MDHALLHVDGCGGIAFYLKEIPLNGGRLTAENITYPNGVKPQPFDEMRCQTCNQQLSQNDLLITYCLPLGRAV